MHKHARAINVWVSLTLNGPDVRLVVEDDGVGGASPRAGHFGLHTMRERAERIGADLEVGARHDGGTVVTLRSRPADTNTMGGHGMTNVLLVDDHELIRQGLARAFERDGSMTVIGQAGSVAEALTAWKALRPDVVVTDLQLPDGTGLDIVRALRDRERRRRPGDADHARRRRPDLRGNGGGGVGVPEQGCTRRRGRQCRRPRCKGSAQLPVHRTGRSCDAAGVDRCRTPDRS